MPATFTIARDATWSPTTTVNVMPGASVTFNNLADATTAYLYYASNGTDFVTDDTLFTSAVSYVAVPMGESTAGTVSGHAYTTGLYMLSTAAPDIKAAGNSGTIKVGGGF